MKNKDLIIPAILIILIGAGLIWQEKKYSREVSSVSIKTDKTAYQIGNILRLAIINNLEKNICFSSCYPYLLERKYADWTSYAYQQCLESDINQFCLAASQSKFFEINLPNVDQGSHRLAIPVCISCRDNDSFKEDNRFYSNEFIIQ